MPQLIPVEKPALPVELFRRQEVARAAMRRSALWTVGAWVVVGASAVAPFGSAWLSALLAAACLWWSTAMLAAWREVARWPEIARVVPYFDRQVSGPETFFQGYALAHNWGWLESLAHARGVTPLSVFGFADALRGDPDPTWHDPAAALPIIEKARAEIGEDAGAAALRADLERLRDRLCAAVEAEARFCLHLRMDTGYSSAEFDARFGRY